MPNSFDGYDVFKQLFRHQPAQNGVVCDNGPHFFVVATWQGPDLAGSGKSWRHFRSFFLLARILNQPFKNP